MALKSAFAHLWKNKRLADKIYQNVLSPFQRDIINQMWLAERLAISEANHLTGERSSPIIEVTRNESHTNQGAERHAEHRTGF